MAFLKLEDIGKIYVSEGAVSVGIRGVNLSFEKGEFVAVTGKSGSGKSTLLNVISGMDSYEEGELSIEGTATSHFTEADFEEYREKYISFIFQDYNIIESFTVLENVELALLHIENKKERRKRALELISRVGLSSHARQKGSRLSGGQKQRTVIARALAKDSPIILADEPTGNLDSETSREIISLLSEVSSDKLVIVVTHNFDDFKDVATRHVRIFDGSVEYDHPLRAAKTISSEKTEEKKASRGEKIKKDVKNGMLLGRAMFLAKPKLSAFLSVLLIIGMLGVFLITSLSADLDLFPTGNMFTHVDGRLVLVKQDGDLITDAELNALATEYGAKGQLHFDSMLDRGSLATITVPGRGDDRIYANYVYGKDYGESVIGKYPEAANEIFLYLPISYKPLITPNGELTSSGAVIDNSIDYRISGVKYYYDNNIEPECLFTEEGFRAASAINFLNGIGNVTSNVTVGDTETGEETSFEIQGLYVSFDLTGNEVYIDATSYNEIINQDPTKILSTEVSTTLSYVKYNYEEWTSKTYDYSKIFSGENVRTEKPSLSATVDSYVYKGIFISPSLACEIADTLHSQFYRQASLFFENDAVAKDVSEILSKSGYVAVLSSAKYELDGLDALLKVISGVVTAVTFILAIVFIAFFINLCTGRVQAAFKRELSIMRSMGISVSVIRIGMYFRMFIALIPAMLLLILSAALIFTSPLFNAYFTYLYFWQYALIVLGMVAICLRTTHKQLLRLFSQSVKKSLAGGNAE